MKKTLIGLCDNVSNNKEKIKLWSESFKKHSDSEIVLIAANMTENDKLACNKLNIKFHPVEMIDTRNFMHKRIEHLIDWIKNSNSDIILSTDVFDVIFQADPFKKLNINTFDFFVGGEGVEICQEPWNRQNISVLFEEELEKCCNREVICAGVVAGKRQAIIAVYEKMFKLCENCPNNHDIKDQAALNVMIANNEIPNLKIFNLDDGWVMHCAVAGPTQFFENWGFKDNLKYGIPQMKDDGRVYTKSGNLFDIVHQFNRVPEWHQRIRETI
jgi:hypothetical protein